MKSSIRFTCPLFLSIAPSRSCVDFQAPFSSVCNLISGSRASFPAIALKGEMDEINGMYLMFTDQAQRAATCYAASYPENRKSNPFSALSKQSTIS